MIRTQLKKHSILCAAALTCLLGLSSSAQAIGSAGTDFWLTFPYNRGGTPALNFYISAVSATTATVQIPGLGFSTTVSIPASGMVTIGLPSAAMLANATSITDSTEGNGIHVTSTLPITVYGLNRIPFSTDGYLGLPVNALGLSYRVMSYANSFFTAVNANLTGTLLAVVATQNNTTVTITPRQTVGTHPAGVPYNIVLQQGQTYQLADASNINGDLTGTLVAADKPIAVFGGHACTNVPADWGYCDHLIEQMFPLDTWGKNFVTYPLATRLAGDTFRILANVPGTVVSINGVAQPPLPAGGFLELTLTAATVIQATEPVLVAQFSKGTSVDNVTSDPFEMLIPPVEQFVGNYGFSTPASGFAQNYINLVIPAGDLSLVQLDGVFLSSGIFSAIGASGYYGARVAVGLGPHTLSAPLAFGVSVYGFDSSDSYGYPGGVQLAAVATVASLTLTPKTASLLTGNFHCVTATVFNTLAAPVVGARVDFVISGANAGSSFAFTDAAGQAVYCWNGALPGLDSIVANLGSLSDTATATWYNYSPTITPTFSVSPTMTPSRTITATFTHTATRSATPTVTPTLTASPTSSPTPTPSATRTATASATATSTFSNTPTWTHTPTITSTFTITPTFSISPTFTITTTPISQSSLLTVRGVYPNPFAGQVHVHYVLKFAADMDFTVYNVAGEIVHRRQIQGIQGANLLAWEGTNEAGGRVASGTYICRLIAQSGANAPEDTWFRVAVAR